MYALKFFMINRIHGFLVLGAVFLVATGSETLYADMGHFGRKPIRLTWTVLVLPALLLNYFGQGALLLDSPHTAHNPFFSMVPSWAMIPMVLLATMATIIASQAVISGSFSLTRQAIQMGYLPRMKVIQTSASRIGQIYVAPVNWLLMISTIGLVAGFQSSGKLAAAYGVAVTSTMLITSILFYVISKERWGWSFLKAGSLALLFLLVDFTYFSANLGKILHGAWFPLAIGLVFFMIMLTWGKGRRILSILINKMTPSYPEFEKQMKEDPPKKIRGQAIFLTGKSGKGTACFDKQPETQ